MTAPVALFALTLVLTVWDATAAWWCRRSLADERRPADVDLRAGRDQPYLMGRVVIACYVPKAGLERELRDLVGTHVTRLRAQGLVTDREPIIAVAADGTVVEVFEWASKEAIAAAHTNPAIRAMWDEFDRVCSYLPVGGVAEAARLFAEFEPL